MGMKGFYFSLDAILGLMLIGAATALILSSTQLSNGVSSDQIRFDQYTAQSTDIAYLIRQEDFSAINQTYRDDLVADSSLEISETQSIAEALLALHTAGEPETEELASQYLSEFQYDTGLYINDSEIKTIDAEEKASSKFTVPGKEGPTEFMVVVGE